MTKEEIIKKLKYYYREDETIPKEILMAIKALEQTVTCPYYCIDDDGHGVCKNHRYMEEPCEDATKHEYDTYCSHKCEICVDAECPLRCEDTISREDALKVASDECQEFRGIYGRIEERIKTLSPVIPSRPKGRWIVQDIYNCHTNFKCSECGYIHSFMHIYGKPTADYTYCPFCGAEMEESEVSE